MQGLMGEGFPSGAPGAGTGDLGTHLLRVMDPSGQHGGSQTDPQIKMLQH